MNKKCFLLFSLLCMSRPVSSWALGIFGAGHNQPIRGTILLASTLCLYGVFNVFLGSNTAEIDSILGDDFTICSNQALDETVASLKISTGISYDGVYRQPSPEISMLYDMYYEKEEGSNTSKTDTSEK